MAEDYIHQDILAQEALRDVINAVRTFLRAYGMPGAFSPRS